MAGFHGRFDLFERACRAGFLAGRGRRHRPSHTRPHRGRIVRLQRDGDVKPFVHALLRELARHRKSLNLYHSLWSVSGVNNSKWRNPRFGDYDYVTARNRGGSLHCRQASSN